MRITITIDVGNAAFADDYEGEVRDIMRAATVALVNIGRTEHTHNLLDSNGNSVGSVVVADDG